ncbi:MAG TPA: sugar transferase [Bryobacteraceae bacterium]|nr:sugar transferase [Bryobacteraceae bacterium]
MFSRDDIQSGGNRIRLVHVTTVPQTLGFVSGQVAYMRQRGFEVVAISSPGAKLTAFGEKCGISVEGVAMARQITPLQDLVTVLKLYRIFHRLRPAIVHAHTPKAGLLAMMAAFLARVPVRIFQVHGLPHVAWSGWKRMLMVWTARVACSLATRILCVSKSMLQILEDERLCPPGKAALIHNGSTDGVDSVGTYSPETYSVQDSASLRRSWGADEGTFVVGYFGRLVRDKGIEELVAAFRMLEAQESNLHLVVAGEVEAHDPVSSEALDFLRNHRRIHYLGWRPLGPLYAAIDLLVLPTYREGYPTVILEAGSMALPVVATRVPGCIDAVVDGRTGTLIAPRDPVELAGAIRRYAADPDLCRRHGQNGRERAVSQFSPADVSNAIYSEYKRALRVPDSRGFWPRLVKRAFDITVAFTVGLFLLPVLLCIAAIVRWRIGRPVLFRQIRPGQDGELITVYKFRTMTEERDRNNLLLPDAQRLTRVGRFLRAASLDELPELWNVLKGDMSLVGPRPLLPRYLDRYTPEQHRRHNVKPGITGWAQVNGRNSLSWERRFELDVWYVDHQSFALDLKILWMTVAAVVLRSGISAEGHATMPEFLGVCAPKQPS